jgi:hypothetical protein
LVAVLPDSLDASEVSEPTRPSLAGRWRFPGARGAVWWRGAVMAYGREGLVRVDQGGLHRATVDSCVMPNVLSAAAAGDVFYALTDAALEVYDGRLCRLGRAPLEGSHDAARSIACAGSALAIGGLEGLAVFDSHDPMTPQRRAKAQIAVRRLSTPPMRTGFDAAVVAELEDGSACLLLLDDHDIEEVARYPVSPWFTGCVRLGDLLIRPDSSGAGLELLSIGPTEIR